MKKVVYIALFACIGEYISSCPTCVDHNTKKPFFSDEYYVPSESEEESNVQEENNDQNNENNDSEHTPCDCHKKK